jgi:hypothetical protein
LIELLGEFSSELYKTFVQLGHVFKPRQFIVKEVMFVPRIAHNTAVAARHWYSTATAAVAESDLAEPLVLLGLPGSYSVRGDWFLGIVRGSRSRRLGDRIIDLLCNRRGNIVRLQAGMGLPVRDVEGREKGELWTPLLKWDASNKHKSVTYDDIVGLGARHSTIPVYDQFFWLWRSLLKDYDRHARIWQRWLCRTLQLWDDWRGEGIGFATYARMLVEGDRAEMNVNRGAISQCEVNV